MEITKEDWQKILDQNKAERENALKSHKMMIPQMDNIIEFLEKKVKETPSGDPAPSEVEEITKLIGK